MSTAAGDEEQDLTRKQRREQARAQRKALEEAEAAGAARRTRLVQLGAVVGVVVAIVVVILVATGGSSSNKIPKPKELPKIAEQVNSELAGIPQSGNTIGSSTAPVTIQYFGDLECPVCQEFTLGALPTLIQKYVRTGKLRIEYRNLETATREQETFNTQQVAALAAGQQHKLWNYIELFYHEQGQEDSGYVNEKYLQGLAQQVPGLNLASWTAARNDAQFVSTITSDAQAANNAGFTGTPSFLIGKTGGSSQKLVYESLKEPGSFESAIEKLLMS